MGHRDIVAILAPLLLGWLRLKGEQAQWYQKEFGVALLAVVLLGVFVTMVYLSGRSLAKAELRRRATEDMLATSEAFYHTLVETLPQNIFQVTNNIWNWQVVRELEVAVTKQTDRVQLIGTYSRQWRHLGGAGARRSWKGRIPGQGVDHSRQFRRRRQR